MTVTGSNYSATEDFINVFVEPKRHGGGKIILNTAHRTFIRAIFAAIFRANLVGLVSGADVLRVDVH